jgi:peptidoglycan hydrolase-like protein with peptidoglycan-binding domain
MKNFIKIIFSVFILILVILIASPAKALTSSDINMLLNVGLITQTQADILTKNISGSANLTSTTTNVISSNNSSCFNANNDIAFADKDTTNNGNAVSALQNFLNKNGYLSSAPTGYFGNMTLSAVKAFQTANGINSTGYVGPITRTKIKSLACDGNINIIITPVTNKTYATGPEITLSADVTEITAGQPVTLKWNALNAVDQCKITSKDLSGVIMNATIDSSGSAPVNPQIATTYTILCYNKYGIPGSKSISIDILDKSKIPTQQTTKSPVITSISPTTGNRGDIVTITGSNFLATNGIIFDSVSIDNSLILSQDSTSISFKIPEYNSCIIYRCPQLSVATNVETGGQKGIQVLNANGYSNRVTFTLPSKIVLVPANTVIVTAPVQEKLSLSYISPTSGNRGNLATIVGTGFSSSSIILFGGFKVADNLIVTRNSTSISFLIPAFQLGCSDPTYEICPKIPLPGTGLIIETGGTKTVYVMNTSDKSTTTSVTFTLPSQKVSY